MRQPRRVGWLVVVLGSLASAALAPCPAQAEGPREATEHPAPAPREYRPVQRPPVPPVRHRDRVANPLDAFLLARLEAKELSFSAPAGKLRLLRRVTFDLTGLPPSPQEQAAFLADPSPDAHRKVVDRLLASPAFGERQAQHWLDLVRFAETDGFKEDALRPEAWRYRDYVIRAFNSDLPYDAFVRQQLAGDELEPDNPDALVATGYNRLWPDEYNAANLEQRRQEILDDMTDTTGLVFLGLTVGCARCHDHKYDPISQKEYYKLQSFFAPFLPREVEAATPEVRRAHDKAISEWEQKTTDIRQEMEKLLAPVREKLRRDAMTKFRPEIQEAVKTPPDKRTPYQVQIARMAEKQMDRAAEAAVGKLPAEQKKRYQELEKLLPAPPPALPKAHAITDVGVVAPPTYRLTGGDWRKPAREVEPGFLAFLGEAKVDNRLPEGVASTGRRAALARWLTDPKNPLPSRVLANRIWQTCFGQGIVATGNDFGLQGSPATHPELLDWLAAELIEKGWSLKHLYRLMVTSSAYCQDSAVLPDDPAHARALALDRENALLWHARRKRLDGEGIRDSILALSGDLSRRMGGTSAKPALPADLSKYAWKPDERPQDRNRRSVYVLVKRNLRFPLFDAFDLPDLHNSCSRRATTTTAPQALLLLNGEFSNEQSARWAASLRSRHGDDAEALARSAYQSAWGRAPTGREVEQAVAFLRKQGEIHRASLPAPEAHQLALADFCHALFNTNEFLYLD